MKLRVLDTERLVVKDSVRSLDKTACSWNQNGEWTCRQFRNSENLKYGVQKMETIICQRYIDQNICLSLMAILKRRQIVKHGAPNPPKPPTQMFSKLLNKCLEKACLNAYGKPVMGPGGPTQLVSGGSLRSSRRLPGHCFLSHSSTIEEQEESRS